MKIALAQLNFHTGNFEKNCSLVKKAIRQAREKGAELVVFAELAVCGYPPRDFLEYDYFLNECEKTIQDIAGECHGIAVIIGAPSINPSSKGKHLFNSAYFLENGKVVSVTNKTLLPNYDVFDEYRYFEPNRKFELLSFQGWNIALTICEDLWNLADHPKYVSSPMDELSKLNPDFIINISASPFSFSHAGERKSIFRRNALLYKIPVLSVNQIGSQTELIFDGGSLMMNAEGKMIEELDYFKEDLRIVELKKENGKVSVLAGENPLPSESVKLKPELICEALTLGIRDYFGKLGFGKAILGLSGGIDSAVTLVLAANALGKENVLALLMPSEFSSDHSVNDSKQLCENLGVAYEVVPIHPVYESFRSALSPLFKGLPFDLAEENLQARIRGVLLMAMSNKFGYILLNTSNKSELAVGYGTLYGDMCGGLSVLGDIYKTEVYELAKYLNKNSEIIPDNILTKPPSAELKPGQVDSDSLPDYETLDHILYNYIELNTPETGVKSDLTKKVLRMVNASEYKRLQAPPILRVSDKSFGMGRRMPIVAKYAV